MVNDFIGCIRDGNVYGEAVHSCFMARHGGRNYGKEAWRYDRHTNSVMWTDGADKNNMELLNNWLEVRGITNPRHYQTIGDYAAIYKERLEESNFRIYNDRLCSEIWNVSQHLAPEVRLNLLRMAKDFYEKTKLPAPIIENLPIVIPPIIVEFAPILAPSLTSVAKNFSGNCFERGIKSFVKVTLGLINTLFPIIIPSQS